MSVQHSMYDVRIAIDVGAIPIRATAAIEANAK